jgi:hypothetical protein
MGSAAIASVCELNPHDHYARLMVGPHRRRVTPIGAPALVRHLVFWKPPLSSGGSDPLAAFEQRCEGIDSVIVKIYKHLRRSPKKVVDNLSTNGIVEANDGSKTTVLFNSFIHTANGEAAPPPDHIAPDAHRTVKVTFDWHGIPAVLAFENHTEFVTLTTVIDASGAKTPEEIARLKRNRAPVFGRLHRELSAIAQERVKDDTVCEGAHSYLYGEVWRLFHAEILTPIVGAQHHVGDMIADFRGLIIGVSHDARQTAGGSDDGPRTVAMPFTRPSQESAFEVPVRKPARWRGTDLESIWTLLNCGIDGNTELTASLFLDGRAFYATALGDQSGLVRKGACPTPLRYLIYEDTLNRWQLGRLASRINFAGTNRVVATMHFEALHDVGGILLNAGAMLEEALSRSLAKDKGDEESIKALRKQVQEDYEGVEEALSELVKTEVDGPIYARIERSRFYVSQYRQIAKSLRILRVEGFQRYDEFVLQKIGPVYEYIDRLGRRFAQVQGDRSLLLRRLQALDALYEERVISHAQDVADIGLLSVLVPYYTASIAEHFTNEKADHFVWVFAALFGALGLVSIYLSRKFPYVALWQRRYKRVLLAFVASSVIMAGVLVYRAYYAAPEPSQPEKSEQTQKSAARPKQRPAARH